MLGDQIKALRKQNGYSQETLAQRLNVVRQTVSKWEKGLSVPDVEMLERLAEAFEVSVNELLESRPAFADAVEINAVAKQLAVLNEQLAARSRSRKRVIKGILIGVAVVLLFSAALLILSIAGYSNHTSADALLQIELVCTLDGEEYLYTITCDEQYRIVDAGGDAWIADHVQTEQYSDAKILAAQSEDYFTDRDGTCQIKVPYDLETP